MTWNPPTGPQPVASYEYRYRPYIHTAYWTEVTDTGQTTRQVEIDRLMPGATYEVQIRAANQGGAGEWSSSGRAQTLFPPTPTPIGGALAMIFSDPGDETTKLQNAVARTILEYGYGYQTRSVRGAEMESIRNVGQGVTNIHMAVRLPTFDSVLAEAEEGGNLLRLNQSIDDLSSQSAFLIPQYTKTANPGLNSVEDLKRPENQRIFATENSDGKAVLLTCVVEWECRRINEKQVFGYDLDQWVQLEDPRTPETLYNRIRSAFENREDILFYYWWPSALETELTQQFGGYYQLTEPAWGQGCWDRLTSTVSAPNINQACSYPDTSSIKVVRDDLREFAPDALAFLTKWKLSSGLTELLATKARFRFFVLQEDEYREAAFAWLRNSNEWKAWVTPGIADKVLDGLRGYGGRRAAPTREMFRLRSA